MAGTYQGFYKPKNPEKYMGDASKCIYRSGWERKIMIHFDFNTNVIKWGSEEISIPYRGIEGKPHRYYPDFFAVVKQKDGSLKEYLIEVKPYAQTVEPVAPKKKTKSFMYKLLQYDKNVRKWEAAKNYCYKKNWEFLILTEKNVSFT